MSQVPMLRRRQLTMGRASFVGLALALAGCGAASTGSSASTAALNQAQTSRAQAQTSRAQAQTSSVPRARPQVIEPTAGAQAVPATPSEPVGDVNAHAPSLQSVRQQLRLQLVAARVSSAGYINPLRYVTGWERTDQGVDATMPVGAPILAPGSVKILAIIPGWYAGQPLVYWELLGGPDAGKVQYVAEQITGIAPAGTILQHGQPIARFAASGTAIEFGWSTLNGVTLARATTGYEEGQVTPAGTSIRVWLNSLGANAGRG